MSDEKNKRVKVNMSFEDALKKAARTKVNPAIMVEGVGKEYTIPDAAGKKVQFVQISIANNYITHFLLKAVVKSEGKEPIEYTIFLPIDPYQKRSDTVYISYPAIEVPKNGILLISIESSIKEDFEVGSVVYKVL